LTSRRSQERAQALLCAVAVGDALGYLAEGLWPTDIVLTYGGLIEDFPAEAGQEGATGPGSAPGSPLLPGLELVRRRPRRPRTTDDTAFTVLVARSILARGRVDEDDIVDRVLAEPIWGWPGWDEFRLAWKRGERQRRTGTGGAMRVAPVGIFRRVRPGCLEEDLPDLVEDVASATGFSHNSVSSVAASAGLAAAYSVMVEGGLEGGEGDGRGGGALAESAVEAAIQAAELAEREWERREGPDDLCPFVSRQLRWVSSTVRPGTSVQGLRRLGLNPGFRAWEAVPAALAIFLSCQDAREAILCAVNLGGDADSVASMAGGLAAALAPETLPQVWADRVLRENGLEDLPDLAFGLLEMRTGPA